MNKLINEKLEGIRAHVEGTMGEPAALGVVGASTDTSVAAMDEYFNSLVDALWNVGLEEDEVFDLMGDVAEDMEEAGLLPPMPGDKASDEEFAEWMALAKAAGFHDQVLAAAAAE